MNVFCRCSLLTLFCSAAFATTIHVPQDQPTIQDGINAARNGDTVLVAPGTYKENIDFKGKTIIVRSANGPALTTITYSVEGNIVTFDTGETNDSVLEGFTIQGGFKTTGIYTSSSPTIANNRITGNHSCDGAGIMVYFGSPIIEGNTISGNLHDECSGGIGGGGIGVSGQGSAQIIGNLISNNSGGNGGSGGGISLSGAGTPLVMDNIIIGNSIQTSGGGIGIDACCTNAVIVQNLIVNNTASDVGAVYSFADEGAPILVNNTIVSNPTTSGLNTEIYTNSAPGLPTLFYNNIVVSAANQNDIYCDDFNSQTFASFFNNDVYARNGNAYGGFCTDQTGMNGNISANPQFVSPYQSNFRLASTSPAINAGDNNAPDLPSTDFAGNPRIVGGVIDVGAYEYQGNTKR